MSNFPQVEPCTTPDNSEPNITFQNFQLDNNNNSNNNGPVHENNTSQQTDDMMMIEECIESPSAIRQELYPGMVNRVCSIFGMAPEQYNNVMYANSLYSNILRKRRDMDNNDDNNNGSYSNNEKRRKFW